jgi:hypothetical protein
MKKSKFTEEQIAYALQDGSFTSMEMAHPAVMNSCIKSWPI